MESNEKKYMLYQYQGLSYMTVLTFIWRHIPLFIIILITDNTYHRARSNKLYYIYYISYGIYLFSYSLLYRHNNSKVLNDNRNNAGVFIQVEENSSIYVDGNNDFVSDGKEGK